MSKEQRDDGDVRYTLSLGQVKVVLSAFGATIVELHLPDRSGVIKDCVLGFDSRAEYDRERDINPYFGCLVGRVANRIGGA